MIKRRSFLLLAITFSVVISLVNVKAHYIPDDENDSSEESGEEKSKISQFFEDVKCGINHGAKKIKEGATTAYNYIKGKLSPGSTTDAVPAEFPANVTEIFLTDKTPLAPMPITPTLNPANSPVTFPVASSTSGRNNDEPPPVWEIDVRAFINESDVRFPQNVEASSTPMVSLDDRALFDAPSFCPDGEMKDRNGRCRKIS